ncbi:MAG: hypothetical protein R3F65_17615 [bacterium]
MTPARLAALAVALVALLLALALWPNRTQRGEDPAPPAPRDLAAPVAPRGAAPPPPRARPAAPAAADALAADAPSDDARPALESPVETYRTFAIYPPDSRPLTADNIDLLEPNRRHERPQTDPDDPTLTALFTADRYHLVGDDTLTPILDVRRDGQPAPVEIIDAHVELPGGARRAYALEPRDGLYVGLVRPADYALHAPAELTVTATFDHGAGPKTARLRAHYVPDDAAPARWTATHRDAMVDGSLVVTVELDVDRAGLYLIDANLYDPHGEPVAWTRVKEPLAEGRQTVALRFFGKVIHDSGRDGPYTLGQLRGALAAPDRTPSRVSMPHYPGEITTARYLARDFAAAEWDAPEKHDRLRRLERLEALGDAPRVGRPLPPQ